MTSAEAQFICAIVTSPHSPSWAAAGGAWGSRAAAAASAARGRTKIMGVEGLMDEG